MTPPKPTFIIRVDGDLLEGEKKPRRQNAREFPTLAEAEATALGLFKRSHKRVEIVDRMSGEIVKVFKSETFIEDTLEKAKSKLAQWQKAHPKAVIKKADEPVILRRPTPEHKKIEAGPVSNASIRVVYEDGN